MRVVLSLLVFFGVLHPAPGFGRIIMSDEVELSEKVLRGLHGYYEANYRSLQAEHLEVKSKRELPGRILVIGEWRRTGGVVEPVEVDFHWVLGSEIGKIMTPLLGEEIRSNGEAWVIDGITIRREQIRFLLMSKRGEANAMPLFHSGAGPPWLRPEGELKESAMMKALLERLSLILVEDPWRVEFSKSGRSARVQSRGSTSTGESDNDIFQRRSPRVTVGLALMAYMLCVVGVFREWD